MNSRARAKNSAFLARALKFPLADSPAPGSNSENFHCDHPAVGCERDVEIRLREQARSDYRAIFLSLLTKYFVRPTELSAEGPHPVMQPTAGLQE